MKRIIIVLGLILAFCNTSNATHVIGGEIGWRCLSTGSFVFEMKVYINCEQGAAGWTYEDEILNIVGSPLPSGGMNSILVKPDSNRWRNERNGDTSPECTPDYGPVYSCALGSTGMVRQYFYISDPIQLTGTPPANGWRFFWEAPCCRPLGTENLVYTGFGGNMLLRAVMYGNAAGDPTDVCYDSSPLFRALPATSICRNYLFTYNHTAIDNDLDSLVYNWDRPYNDPQNNPTAIPYEPGYNFDNPTPDATANVNNVPSTMDKLTGVTELAVFSGTGIEKFVTVIRVDAYRGRRKIATVYREIPIAIFNCPPLPNGQANNVPEVYIDGRRANDTIVDIVAGQVVSIPITVEDFDFTGVGSQLQTVTLIPDGLLFSNDRQRPEPCQVNPNPRNPDGVGPCAILRDSDPELDQNLSPATYKIEGVTGVGTEFVWQTACRHIKTKTGVPGTNQGVYNFVMRVYDDHCPIPAINYPTITVRVFDPKGLTQPILKGISANLDGSITYNWVPPLDSTYSFDNYKVQTSTTQFGNSPTLWNSLNPQLKLYREKRKDPNYPVYDFKDPFIGQASGIDLLSERGTKDGQEFDFYLRMQTKSGCSDTISSAWSDPARVIELESTPDGQNPDPVRSAMKLNWNPAKPIGSFSYPYFLYESPTRYYIWANDSISNGGVGNEDNWYITGSTYDTEFRVGASNCSDFVGFRIEARDTVISYRQGNGPNPRDVKRDSIEMFAFSTFSIIDTAYMVNPPFIPKPQFDTLEVLPNGTVFLKIDLAGKLTTGRYNIYKDNVAPGNLLASVKADQDSVIVVGTGNSNYVIEGIDGCDPNTKSVGNTYNTYDVNGGVGSLCSGEYTVNWTKPGGFRYRFRSYKVLLDSTGNGFEEIATINDSTQTTYTLSGLRKSTTYRFKIVTVDRDDVVNISSIHSYTTPATLQKPDLLNPPEARCTFVETNGSVTISFLPPDNSIDNFGNYEILYAPEGSNNFTRFGNANYPYNTTSVTVTGVNAQNQRVNFRLYTLAGCEGSSRSLTFSTISSVFVEAVPVANDPDKKGNILFNTSQIQYASNNYYDVYKGIAGDRYASPFYKSAVNTNFVVDNNNGLICDGRRDYYVDLFDEVYAPDLSCTTRSNIATARYVDTILPPPNPLTVISFDLTTGGINAYWDYGLSDEDSIQMLTLDEPNSGLQGYEAITAYQPERNTTGGASPNSVLIPFTVLDGRDSSVAVASSTKDPCENLMDEDELFFHRTMDLDAEWNICDSVNELVWNPYVGFNPDFDIEYTVFVRTSPNGAWGNAIDTLINDTTYNALVIQGGLTYSYHIEARSLDPAAPGYAVSNSNIASAYSIYEDEPLYGYLQYVTVLPTNNIELQYYVDTVIRVKGYTIFRGEEENNLSPVGYFSYDDVDGDSEFTFVDNNVKVNNLSYYYNVLTENACDIPVATSNIGRSILLSIETDNESLTNKLTWNRYEGWDSTVAYYNLYRGIDGTPGNTVYKVIAPNSNYRWNEFVDDVYGQLEAAGEFCYRIEAVQGPINDKVVNGYPHNLPSATSSSNTVCVVQNPLFYVPNAFAPDGVNRIFRPKGQFFDFSQYEMIIYNRWGEQIYSTRDINKGWDGTVDGTDATAGSYVYMIRYIDASGKQHRKKGTLTLIR